MVQNMPKSVSQCTSRWKYVSMGGVALDASNFVGYDTLLFGKLLPTLRRFCTLFEMLETGRRREENSPKPRPIFASLHGVTYLKIWIPKFIPVFPSNSVRQRFRGTPSPITTTTISPSLGVQPRQLQIRRTSPATTLIVSWWPA